MHCCHIAAKGYGIKGPCVSDLVLSAIRRTLGSGGTRIRTGDTMIFSSVAYFPPCIIVSVESAKVSHFLHADSPRRSAEYRYVPSWLVSKSDYIRPEWFPSFFGRVRVT
jgi:hypothetical protein